MSYAVSILRRAQRELIDLPRDVYDRIRDALHGLSENPRPHGCSKLAGREGWRVRCGDYRIIYEINDTDRTVVILHVGHRRDVYR